MIPKVVEFPERVEINTTDGNQIQYKANSPILMFGEYEFFVQNFNAKVLGDLTDFCPVHYKLQDVIDHDDIVVLCDMAIGDALQMTPIIRKIKKDYPDKNIKFAIGYANKYIWMNSGTEVLPLPTHFNKVKNYAFLYVDFPLGFHENVIKVFAECIGMDYPEDDKLECIPHPDLIDIWHEWLLGERTMNVGGTIYESTFYKPGLPLVILQLAASSINRTYNPNKILEVADKLTEVANCIVLGTTEQAYVYLANIKQDGLQLSYDLDYLYDYKFAVLGGMTASVRDYIALVKNADVLVSCDSSLLHLGSAFSIPTIAVMNTIKPIHNFYDKNVIILHGKKMNCDSCVVCKYPDEYGFGKCMDINPQEIVDTVKRVL